MDVHKGVAMSPNNTVMVAATEEKMADNRQEMAVKTVPRCRYNLNVCEKELIWVNVCSGFGRGLPKFYLRNSALRT